MVDNGGSTEMNLDDCSAFLNARNRPYDPQGHVNSDNDVADDNKA